MCSFAILFIAHTDLLNESITLLTSATTLYSHYRASRLLTTNWLSHVLVGKDNVSSLILLKLILKSEIHPYHCLCLCLIIKTN